jgi:hypothetical protein
LEQVFVLAGISFIVPSTHNSGCLYIFGASRNLKITKHVKTTQAALYEFAASTESFFGGGTVMGLELQVWPF